MYLSTTSVSHSQVVRAHDGGAGGEGEDEWTYLGGGDSCKGL